jgi:hypothetical protein
MAVWLFVVTACDSGRAPSPAPTPVSTPPRVVGDAASMSDAAADAASAPDAAPALTIPDSLAAAPPWVGRKYMTGAASGTRPHLTYRLQTAGGQALITVEEREGSGFVGKGPMSEPTVWNLVSTIQYLGTATTVGTKTLIKVSGPAGTLDWECKTQRIAIAKANAVRGRTPGLGGCEGDTGRWVPGTTTSTSALVCNQFPGEEYAGDWDQLAFTPAPGVEWLFVNDDCVIQGGGWRAVPTDGAIGRVRPPDAGGGGNAPGKTGPRKSGKSATNPRPD